MNEWTEAGDLADELKHNLTSENLSKAIMMLRQQERTIDGDKRLIELLYEKVHKQQDEIAELKHINRNWQISEEMAYSQIEQQQAEIEALKKIIECKEIVIPSSLLKQQQAEIEALKERCNSLKEVNDGFARHLISNPPKEQLTDEEIETIFQKETGFTLDCDAKVDEVAMLDFARAILRKAQEK